MFKWFLIGFIWIGWGIILYLNYDYRRMRMNFRENSLEYLNNINKKVHVEKEKIPGSVKIICENKEIGEKFAEKHLPIGIKYKIEVKKNEKDH